MTEENILQRLLKERDRAKARGDTAAVNAIEERIDEETGFFTQGLNLGRSALQGLTLGAGDEIIGGLNAAIVAPFSDRTFGEVYEQARDRERAGVEVSRTEDPVLSFMAEMAGGALGAGKLGAATKGIGMLRNIPTLARTIGAGGLLGGIYGFNAAEEGNRLQSGLLGGGLGAGITAVAAPVAQKVAPAIGRVARGMWNAGVSNTPRRQAERIIGRAAQADMVGPANLSDEMARVGQGGVLADVGENLRGLARGASSMIGSARRRATEFLNERQQQQLPRLLKAMGLPEDMRSIRNFGRGFQEWVGSRITAADAAYARARQVPIDLSSRPFRSLMQRPIMQQMRRTAERQLKDSGTPLSDVSGRYAPLELIQAMKEGLDDRIGVLMRQGARNRAGRLIELKRQFVSLVDNQNPDYGQARQIFSSEAALRNARDMGRRLFRASTDVDEMAMMIEDLTDSERMAFRIGALRALVDKIDNAVPTRNTAAKLIESNRARDLLRMVFPDDNSFANFLRVAEGQGIQQQTRNMVLGGSPTARIQAEQEFIEEGIRPFQNLINGNPVAAMADLLKSLGFGKVSDETLEEMAKILLSPDLPSRQVQRMIPTSTALPPMAWTAGTAGAGGAVTQSPFGQEVAEETGLSGLLGVQ